MKGQQLLWVMSGLAVFLVMVGLSAIAINAVTNPGRPIQVALAQGGATVTADQATMVGDGSPSHPVALKPNSVTWSYLLHHGSCAEGQYLSFDAATGGFTCGSPPDVRRGELAAVALSGQYADLSDRPVLGQTPSGASLPAACTVGLLFLLTQTAGTNTVGLYACLTANTYTKVGP